MLGQKSRMPRCRLVLAAAFVLGLAGVVASHAQVPRSDDAPRVHENKLIKIYEVNINKLIDRHLDDIRRTLGPLDPTELEDIQYKLLAVSYTLTKGWIQNLPLLNRSGDCKLIYKDRVLTGDFNVVWYDVAFDYRYTFKSWPIKKTGDFHGQLYDLFVNVVYKYDFKTYKLTLDKFTFKKVGELKISTEGNILDKLSKLFVRTLTKLLKNVLLKVIESNFRKMLEHNIPDEEVFANPERFLAQLLDSSDSEIMNTIRYH